MKIYGKEFMGPHERGDKSCNDPRCDCENGCQNAAGKGGDIRSNYKNSLAKRRGRRTLKKLARNSGKEECKQGFED